MFYCEPCRVKNSWPESLGGPFGMSRGPCEICKQVAVCHDVPSKALPMPKRPEQPENAGRHATPTGRTPGDLFSLVKRHALSPTARDLYEGGTRGKPVLENVDFVALERRAAAMMGRPTCPFCGRPAKADGDGALYDHFTCTDCPAAPQPAPEQRPNAPERSNVIPLASQPTPEQEPEAADHAADAQPPPLPGPEPERR